MRGRPILVAVGLVAVMAVGACEPAPPVPVTPPPEPADVVPWPDIVWAQADMPAPPPFVTEHIAAVAADPTGFVAVGYRETVGRRDGVIWFSADGRSWEVVGVPAAFAEVDLVDVAAGASGFVAIGTALGEGRIMSVFFHSDDGRVWERLGPPGVANSYANYVAGGPSGYLASGTGADGGSAVWASPDGRTWERVAPDAMGDGGQGINDPQALADGWVALGSNVQPPFLMRSADGMAWSATPIESPTEAYAFRLVAGRWGYLAQGGLGTCGPLSSCPAEAATWWSGDGAGWTRLPAGDALQSGGSVLVEAGDHGFVALDGVSAWASATGWSWTPLPEPGDGSSVVNAAVVRGDVIVAVGETYLEDGTSVGAIIVAE